MKDPMTKRLVSFSSVLLLLATLGHFYAKPLMAQIKAALVQNVDEPGRNPYLSTAQLAPICVQQGSDNCVLVFAAPPAGKRLVLTNITGNIYPQTPGIVPILRLNVVAAGRTVEQVYIPTFLEAGTYFSRNIIGVNAQLNVFSEPDINGSPLVEIFATTELIEAHLALSGYLVSLP
jgi:hypothetical protein